MGDVQAPPDEQQAYLDLVDRWRTEVLKVGHNAMCRVIGADRADWRRFRERRRPPTEGFHARVVAAAAHPWTIALEEAWSRFGSARRAALRERVGASTAAECVA